MLGLLPLLLLHTAPAPAVEGPWLVDLDKAREVAAETQRDLLVDFTGSDWCSWCKKLDREVFRETLFREAAASEYVLVKIDIPRTPAAIAKVPDIARNRALAREHKVNNFPTILLMTAGGETYARTGYKEGGAAAYWSHVQALRKEFRGPHVEAIAVADAFDEATEAATEPATEESRAKLAERALAVFPKLPPTSPILPRLIPVVGIYAELDPENVKGDLGRALQVLLPSGYATAEQIAIARKLDPDNTKGLLELALLADAYAIQNERDTRRVAKAILALDKLGPIRNEQAARVLYTNGAIWTDRFLRDTPAAKGLARKALPYVKKRPQLEAQVKRILGKRS